MTSSPKLPMTPETEIDALARELYAVKTASDGWRTTLSCVKSEWKHLARHVLAQRIRAQREAFVIGSAHEFGYRVQDFTRHGTSAERTAKRIAEAERRYPLPESDAPRVPDDAPPRIAPFVPRGEYDSAAFFDGLRRYLNELAEAVNALRASRSSLTQEKAS